ncbi:MAG: LytS/YhcK type 5TM receptor domain-containing protein [Bacteroidota bacterium]
MNPDMILGLIHNIALLISISLLGGVFWKKESDKIKLTDKFLMGLFLGGIGVVIMLTPWILVPGLVFDTRSVLLSVSGLFFGPIPTFTAILITGLYRVILGGDGMWMGLGVIFTSGIFGILWRTFRPRWQEKRPAIELGLLGVTVHLAMLACAFLLPAGRVWSTLQTIALPVMIIYPLGNILFGLLLLSRFRHFQTKRDLLQSEEKFRQLFEKSDVMMLLVEPDSTRIVDANAASARFYGFSIEALTKKRMTEINIPSPERNSESRQKEFFEEAGCIEFGHQLATGEVRTVEVHSSPIFFNNQTLLFSIIHDITARKKAEKALVEAKERAEESDRLKSTFLATMSHELRTPLNAIIGFSDLMSDGLEMANVQKFSKSVYDSGIQLLSIIESIFDIALLQSKESKVKMSTFQISELFSKIGYFLSVERKRKNYQNLDIRYHPDPLFPDLIIQTDTVKLTQLLSNLLNNALKYAGSGKVDYGYKVNGAGLIFFVKDTGIGIPADKLEMIFKPFTQLDDSYTRVHGGVGLGLAICSEIAALLKGQLWAESDKGKGAAFFFKLDHVIVPDITGKSVSGPGEAVPDMTNKTILIVDDLVENTFLLTSILTGTKAKILSAESGNNAIRMVKENPSIDLILMDIKMPELNGYETTRAIHSFRPGIPVIAQTAYAFKEDKELAKAAGCVNHIAKPIQKKELFEILRNTVPA